MRSAVVVTIMVVVVKRRETVTWVLLAKKSICDVRAMP